MNAASDWDWLYVAIGWAIAAAAVALALWAMFKDRPRGRRRCPKCWYDMGGTPGLRCPECGREARSEHKLLKTRRRWRLLAIASLVALVGYAAGSVPAYRQGGWVRLVPSTVLVFIAPTVTTSSAALTRNFALVPPPVAGAPGTASVILAEEAWQRLRDRKLAGWQSQAFLGRYVRDTKWALAKELTLPDRWPIGEVIPAIAGGSDQWNAYNLSVIVRDFEGAWRSTRAVWLPASPRAAKAVRVELGLEFLRPVYRTSKSIPIIIEGTRDSLLVRFDSPAATGLARAALAPQLAASATGPVVIVRDRSDQAPWPEIDFGLSYTFEIRINGEVVGSGAGTTDWRTAVWKDWDEIAVTWVGNARERIGREPASITVRGDVEGATRDYIAWPFDKRAACWTGEFTMPLEFKPHPGKPTK